MKTDVFSIPIYNMPPSTILVEDSLEGKCYHCPLKWLYKRNLPQADTFKMWLPNSLAEFGEQDGFKTARWHAEATHGAVKLSVAGVSAYLHFS